uniref:NADH-ubiquinone oxidoreductase chain 6 n=1 Tax=Acroneuria hainana TaxID=1571577 RepID=A0A0A7DU95_9NEOP|nr:NADH dehydrogenase subunit 6 [Acroneuria hainana]AIX03646.1 NADH dehydrogenase subunit 6 [Acroneuria hainana]
MFNFILMASSSILALIFTQMMHPLAMGMLLLLQTLVICLITGFMTQNFWFSYILFLVFLGGLLVLFIYVTSLASNEMFSLSTFTLLLALVPLSICTVSSLILDPSILPTPANHTEIFASYTEEITLSLMKLYNTTTSTITLMLVLYLFLTLIAVVKITKIFHGPLRPQN